MTILSNTELHIIICVPAKEGLCLKCLREGDSFDRCHKTVIVKVMDLCIGWLMLPESCWKYDTKVESWCKFSDLHLFNRYESLKMKYLKSK